MSKHTPGPWTFDEISKAALFTQNDEVFLQLKTRDTGYESSKANARLIVASPEMYEMLRVSRTVMKDAQDDIRSLLGANSIIYQRMQNALDRMNAIIAKATEA